MVLVFDAVVGQLEAAGVAQHVGVDLELILASSPARASCLAKADGVNGPTTFRGEDEGRGRVRKCSRYAGSIAVAEGASIRLRRRGVATGAGGITERRSAGPVQRRTAPWGHPGQNGCVSRSELLAGPSGSANLVVFPPVLRSSISVGGRGEGNGLSVDIIKDCDGEQGDRSCNAGVLDEIIGDPCLAEPCDFGARLLCWDSGLLFVHLIFSESVAAEPRGSKISGTATRADHAAVNPRTSPPLPDCPGLHWVALLISVMYGTCFHRIRARAI